MSRMGTVLMAICLAAGGAASALAGELTAGVACVDLTPPMSMKASLGGYGARKNKPAEGVHDRIFAKALVLSDGTKRFALVTADVLAFPPGFKQAVLKALEESGWTSDQVMLLPSHSHTSIDMTAINPKNVLKIPELGIFHKELYDLTIANLAKVITQADAKPVPVKVGTTSIDINGWNRNRRKDSKTSDPELTVTRLDKTDGKPLAVLVNWTAHPTFMDDVDMMFSGGWPGHLQRTLETLIGDGVTAMYYNGAQGDQSPVARPDSGDSNWEKAERYGRELALVAWRQWGKTAPSPSAVLDYHRKRLKLPKPTYHPDFMETGGKEYGLDPETMQTILTVFVPPVTEIGFLRIGDLLIVGIPGELAAGLGMGLKAKLREITGIKHVVIGGLANEWISYIISAEEYAKGGYESSVTFYGPTLAQTLLSATESGVTSLKQ
ncbi:MAG: neutral/alkaline non-lysosomal ceramidase N-terminal domain-containing protein [Phycisphaerae bacterium]|nr:neutral/alkaline non-lysosomal ceramidase N-terminal domain-containing protein [Phycisphaerae bacterium]